MRRIAMVAGVLAGVVLATTLSVASAQTDEGTSDPPVTNTCPDLTAGFTVSSNGNVRMTMAATGTGAVSWSWQDIAQQSAAPRGPATAPFTDWTDTADLAVFGSNPVAYVSFGDLPVTVRYAPTCDPTDAKTLTITEDAYVAKLVTQLTGFEDRLAALEARVDDPATGLNAIQTNKANLTTLFNASIPALEDDIETLEAQVDDGPGTCLMNRDLAEISAGLHWELPPTYPNEHERVIVTQIRHYPVDCTNWPTDFRWATSQDAQTLHCADSGDHIDAWVESHATISDHCYNWGEYHNVKHNDVWMRHNDDDHGPLPTPPTDDTNPPADGFS